MSKPMTPAEQKSEYERSRDLAAREYWNNSPSLDDGDDPTIKAYSAGHDTGYEKGREEMAIERGDFVVRTTLRIVQLEDDLRAAKSTWQDSDDAYHKCTVQLAEARAEIERLKLIVDELHDNESKMDGALSAKQEIVDTLRASPFESAEVRGLVDAIKEYRRCVELYGDDDLNVGRSWMVTSRALAAFEAARIKAGGGG